MRHHSFDLAAKKSLFLMLKLQSWTEETKREIRKRSPLVTTHSNTKEQYREGRCVHDADTYIIASTDLGLIKIAMG